MHASIEIDSGSAKGYSDPTCEDGVKCSKSSLFKAQIFTSYPQNGVTFVD